MTGGWPWAVTGAAAGEGELRYAPDFSSWPTAIAVHAPDRLAVVAGATLDVWDLDANAVRLRLGGYEQRGPGASLLMVDGALLRIAGDELALWDLRSEWSRRVLATGVSAEQVDVAGRWIALRKASDTIELLHLDDGRRLVIGPTAHRLASHALSPDATRVAAAGGGGDVVIYSVPDGELLHTLHRDGVESAKIVWWEPEGPAVLHRNGEIVQWTLQGHPRASVTPPPGGQHPRWSSGANERWVAGSHSSCGFLPGAAARAAGLEVAVGHEGLCVDGRLLPFTRPDGMDEPPLWGTGHRLATVGHSIRVWDLHRGTSTRVFDGGPGELTGFELAELAKQLGSLPPAGGIPAWFQYIEDERPTAPPDASRDLRSVAAFTPGSRSAGLRYSTSADEESGEQESLPDWDLVNRLSRDGRWLARARPDTFRVYVDDISTQQTRAELTPTDPQLTFRGHRRVAIAPDGGLLAMVDADGLLRVKDLARGGGVVHERRLPVGTLRHLAFSPEGDALAAVGEDILVFRILGDGAQVHLSEPLQLVLLPSGDTLAIRGGQFSLPEGKRVQVRLTLDGGRPVPASELRDRWDPDLVSSFWAP